MIWQTWCTPPKHGSILRGIMLPNELNRSIWHATLIALNHVFLRQSCLVSSRVVSALEVFNGMCYINSLFIYLLTCFSSKLMFCCVVAHSLDTVFSVVLTKSSVVGLVCSTLLRYRSHVFLLPVLSSWSVVTDVAWVIGTWDGLQFCRPKKLWGTWCPRYHAHFCCTLQIAARGGLPFLPPITFPFLRLCLWSLNCGLSVIVVTWLDVIALLSIFNRPKFRSYSKCTHMHRSNDHFSRKSVSASCPFDSQSPACFWELFDHKSDTITITLPSHPLHRISSENQETYKLEDSCKVWNWTVVLIWEQGHVEFVS